MILSPEAYASIPAGQSPITFLLKNLPEQERKEFLASLSGVESTLLEHSWDLWARVEQRQPLSFMARETHTWLLLGGRGLGKTRPGAETVIERAKELGHRYGDQGKIALIAQNPADARDVMLEGVSGIMTVSPPWFRPVWEPSKRRVTWPNGVTATVFSSETPDAMRGPQHHFGWWDEPAKSKYPAETWDMFRFGLRLGDDPQCILTGTPRPVKTLLEIIADPDTVVTRGRTQDNAANLAPAFLDYIYRKYAGTRLGRQELNAEILTDTPGALWTLKMIDDTRVAKPPVKLTKVVIALDPNVTDPTNDLEERSDEFGIVVVGQGDDDHTYVLADLSDRLSPAEWSEKVLRHYVLLGADEIIGETNNGGDLIEFVLRTTSQRLRIPFAYRKVTASRGKRTRAEPISSRYEQGRQHHCGMFAELEDQMSTWVPGLKSPDRMDAMVWGATAVAFDEPPPPPMQRVSLAGH